MSQAATTTKGARQNRRIQFKNHTINSVRGWKGPSDQEEETSRRAKWHSLQTVALTTMKRPVELDMAIITALRPILSHMSCKIKREGMNRCLWNTNVDIQCVNECVHMRAKEKECA